MGSAPSDVFAACAFSRATFLSRNKSAVLRGGTNLLPDYAGRDFVAFASFAVFAVRLDLAPDVSLSLGPLRSLFGCSGAFPGTQVLPAAVPDVVGVQM